MNMNLNDPTNFDEIIKDKKLSYTLELNEAEIADLEKTISDMRNKIPKNLQTKEKLAQAAVFGSIYTVTSIVAILVCKILMPNEITTVINKSLEKYDVILTNTIGNGVFLIETIASNLLNTYLQNNDKFLFQENEAGYEKYSETNYKKIRDVLKECCEDLAKEIAPNFQFVLKGENNEQNN